MYRPRPNPTRHTKVKVKGRVPKKPFRMSKASRLFWRAPHPAYPQVPMSLQLAALKELYGFFPSTLATTIGQGNFMTRNFRQKYNPNVGLSTIKHKPNPTRVNKAKQSDVLIPSVSKRRTKDILLSTSTGMYRPKRPNPLVKTKKSATNRTNTKSNAKSRTSRKSVTKVLAKEVKDLKKAIQVDKALHTYKVADCNTLKSLVGRCNHGTYQACSLAGIEAALTNLRYYDPAAPGTLVTANASTGSFARDVFIKDYRTKFVVRNNYQVPVKVKLYYCKVKNDNNDSPLTTYTTAIADQVINASVDETDQLIYLNDIERVREVWNVDCVIDKTLEPGQEAQTSQSSGSFNFDPSHIDTFTNQYQQVFKGSAYVLRVEGVMGHDTSAAEYTLLASGVDLEIFRKVVIEYEAGVNLNDIYIVENRVQAFTNGGVASLKPVADNITYSVS